MSKNHRPLLQGEYVFVYRNLRNKCMSVKSAKTGLVIAHVSGVALKQARLMVSESGRERVRREKKKYVHAGVFGLVDLDGTSFDETMHKRVTYNPYLNQTFVDENGEAVGSASEAYVTTSGVYVA